MSKLFSTLLPASKTAVASFGFGGSARIGILGSSARNISTKIATIPAIFHEKYTDLAHHQKKIYLPIAESLELQHGAKELRQSLESQKRKGCEYSAQILEIAKEFTQEQCQAVLFTNAIMPVKTANIDVSYASVGPEKINGADIQDAQIVIENAPNLMFFAHLLRMCGQETYYNTPGTLFSRPYYIITGQRKQYPHVDGFGLSTPVDSIILHAVSSEQQCETVIIDSDEVLKLLTPEAIKTLQRPIFHPGNFYTNGYREAFDKPDLVPIITQDDKNRLKINFNFSAMAIKSSFDTSMALSELNAASIEVIKNSKDIFNLKTGENLLLNNYRVMHARNGAKEEPASDPQLATNLSEKPGTQPINSERTLLRTFFTKVGPNSPDIKMG